MKSKPFFYLTTILTVFTISPILLTAQEETPSKYLVSYIDGTVRVQKPESEGWVTAESSMALVPGDKIQAAEKSKAEMTMPLGGIVRLNQNSTLWLRNSTDTLIKAVSVLQPVEGDFWANIAAGDSTFSATIELKTGKAAIIPLPETLATIIRIGVGADSTFEIKVYSGIVGVALGGIDTTADSLNRQNFPEEAGQERYRGRIVGDHAIVLHPYQKAIVTSSGKIVFKGAFTRDDIDEKSDWVEWNKGRDAGR